MKTLEHRVSIVIGLRSRISSKLIFAKREIHFEANSQAACEIVRSRVSRQQLILNFSFFPRTTIFVKLSINKHIVGLVHKNHVIRTCLMYHAACKVEFQPFKRSYSQLTFFNFL